MTQPNNLQDSPSTASSLLTDQELDAAWTAFVGETSKDALRAALGQVLPMVVQRHVASALHMGADVIGLVDDSEYKAADYLLDAGDCADVLRALAGHADYVVANAQPQAEVDVLSPSEIKVQRGHVLLLQAARDLGDALLRPGVGARDRDRVFHSVLWLASQGLLSREAPYRVTDLGLAVLELNTKISPEERGREALAAKKPGQPVVTPAQLRLLRHANDHGHAFAGTGTGSRAGGAIRRAVGRLADQGLLTKRAPFQITPAGQSYLAAQETKKK